MTSSPGTDLERVEREHDRVGAVGDADRVLDAEVRGGLLLEGADVRAEDEPAGVENLGDSLLQLVQQRRVLRLDVNERDLRPRRASLVRLRQRTTSHAAKSTTSATTVISTYRKS